MLFMGLNFKLRQNSPRFHVLLGVLAASSLVLLTVAFLNSVFPGGNIKQGRILSHFELLGFCFGYLLALGAWLLALSRAGRIFFWGFLFLTSYGLWLPLSILGLQIWAALNPPQDDEAPRLIAEISQDISKAFSISNFQVKPIYFPKLKPKMGVEISYSIRRNWSGTFRNARISDPILCSQKPAMEDLLNYSALRSPHCELTPQIDRMDSIGEKSEIHFSAKLYPRIRNFNSASVPYASHGEFQICMKPPPQIVRDAADSLPPSLFLPVGLVLGDSHHLDISSLFESYLPQIKEALKGINPKASLEALSEKSLISAGYSKSYGCYIREP